jgi:ribonuclease HI
MGVSLSLVWVYYIKNHNKYNKKVNILITHNECSPLACDIISKIKSEVIVMATAILICDASYNSVLRLGGYAGGIVIREGEQESSTLYHGIAADSSDCTDSEMQAIGSGLKKLNDIIKTQQLEITEVQIYTDSEPSQKQYARFKDQQKHHPKYTKVLSFIDANIKKLPTKNVAIDHVKAHVDNRLASPLEQLHNMVDRSAVSARMRAQNHLHTPYVKKSRHYGVAVSREYSDDEAAKLEVIGRTYAEKGFIARIALIGKSDVPDIEHPIIKGIMANAKERGVNAFSLFDVQKGRLGGGLIEGCSGMDMALVRQAWKDAGNHVRDADVFIDKDYNAGMASRLIYGPQYAGPFNQTHFTGRTEEASRFILNLTPSEQQKKLVSADGWLNMFMPYVDIPYYKNINSALNISLNKGVELISMGDSALMVAVKDCLVTYHEQIEPEQLYHKIEDLIKENTGISGKEVSRVVRLTVGADGKSLDRVMKDCEGMLPLAIHEEHHRQSTQQIAHAEHRELNSAVKKTISSDPHLSMRKMM